QGAYEMLPRTPSAMRGALLAGPLIAIVFCPPCASATTDKLAYGKYLAQECTACHRADGKGQNIPVIFGLEPEYFLSTMRFYKTGARQNPVMNSVAQTLSDEQLDALAAYLAAQKPAHKTSPSQRKK